MKKSEFKQFDNVILTPHLAGHRIYWKRKMAEYVVDDLEQYINGKPMTHEVDYNKYMLMTRAVNK